MFARLNTAFFLTLTGLLIIACALPAQAASGKIAGRIVDKASGDPLPGANIIVEAQWEGGKAVSLSGRLGATADLEGYYVILNISPGNYDVRATMVGYIPMVQRQVRVNLDRTTPLNFGLGQTAVDVGAVQVVAQREVIKADVSSTQEIITTQRIDEAPVMRVDEFVNKIKGVELVANTDGNGLSIRGGAIRETDVRIDGISLRDPRSENSYLSLNSTSVEELQVLTGGFESKYGGFRSGLVNVVTKEGNRDKYTLSVKADMTPATERKFFGNNPWSDDSWIYRVFADTGATGFAWKGTVDNKLVPPELRFFRGWKNKYEGRNNYEAIGLPKSAVLTAEQKRELWLLQHPQYEFAREPDYYLEGTLTGPLPGSWIPLWGALAKRSTIMLGGKYENTQYAFPIGPRDNYVDWNAQAKITTMMTPAMKFSLNGMYANVNTITAGSASTFGGALIDNSSRFNFLSSNSASVTQQAALLGGANGFAQMFNKSRLQFYDQRYILSGAKLTHTISPRTFYDLEFQFSYNDHTLKPFALDTSRADAWISLTDKWRVLNAPTMGTRNGSTNWLTDINNLFWLYGGLQAADSSYTWLASLRGDVTTQIGRHHQVETGFDIRYNYLKVNSGTWAQSEQSWTPDTWQYFTAKPVEIGLYLQDKLEFQGMIANVGLRAEYFNPQKEPFEVRQPLDEDYANLYNLIYEYLPGRFGSWERWVSFREELDSPTGWPEGGKSSQFKLSPRLGVSFPVTTGSKLYFNYGHFYQRPNIHFIYNLATGPGWASVPSVDLDMARTIAYEFGYEQRFLGSFLFNVTLYYKDIKGEPLSRTYIDYWEEVNVSRYFPDSYKDIRGLEVRLEKNLGQYLTFWGNYEYMLQSRGSSGLATVYENRLKAINEQRWPNLTITEPRPRGNFNLTLHTPRSSGIHNTLKRITPGEGGILDAITWLPGALLGDIFVNLFYEWRDGGRVIVNPQEVERLWKRIDVVDYSNLDLRASKMFRVGGVSLEGVLTIQNLLNQKRLSYWNMSTSQYDAYKESLHFPFETGDQHGDDQMGEWDKEHINIGWFTAPLFLNPRRALVGLRINF
ncbi:MAG TPA: TonB-dependent receptor [bacterium]|nr:TonB-dependent receptor [bacterium]